MNLDVNNIVDELHSSPVEKKELKIKLKQVLAQAEGSAQDKEDIEYQVDKKFYQKMPQQVMSRK